MCAINSLLSLVAWLLHIAGDGFSVTKTCCYSTPLPVNSLVNDSMDFRGTMHNSEVAAHVTCMLDVKIAVDSRKGRGWKWLLG